MRIRYLLCVLFITAIWLGVSLGAQVDADLPEIEMQEYVISGVEQATRIYGTRIPLGEWTPVIKIPGSPEQTRPDLQASSISIIPVRPELVADRTLHNFSGGAFGGNFGAFGAGVNGCYDFNNGGFVHNAQLNFSAGYVDYPRRLEPGEATRLNANVSAASFISGRTQIAAGAGYRSQEFILNDTLRSRRTLDALTANFGLSALNLFQGNFNALIDYGAWSVDKVNAAVNGGAVEGLSLAAQMKYDYFLSKGMIQSRFGFFSETLEEFTDAKSIFDLRFYYLRLVYYKKLMHKMNLGVGVDASAGEHYADDGMRSINPYVVFRWGAVPNGAFDFTIDPHSKPVTLRELFSRWTMLDEPPQNVLPQESEPTKWFLNPIIEETPIRMSASYRHSIANSFEASVKGTYRESEQYPYLVPFDSQGLGWTLGLASLTSAKGELSVRYRHERFVEAVAYAAIENAQLEEAGESYEAPLIPPISAGIRGGGERGRWTAEFDAAYYAETPYAIGMAEERPAHFEVDFSAGYKIAPEWTISVEGYNLLNESYDFLPGYDANPLTVMVRLKYGDLFLERSK